MPRFPDFPLYIGLFLTGLVVVGWNGAGPAPTKSSVAAANTTTPARVPVVVELFTSEGCSSCPSADAVLRQLETDQPIPGIEVIALGEHVDYWNRLGWRDPFSTAQLTERQRTYATALGASTYTPQAVVMGHAELVGSQRAKLTQAIVEAAAAPQTRVDIQRTTDPATVSIQIGALPDGTPPTDVWLALTESDLSTPVRRGENAGRTLQHPSVVRAFRPIATISPGGTFAAKVPLQLAVDWQIAHLRAVVLVQERTSRRIVGVGALPLAIVN